MKIKRMDTLWKGILHDYFNYFLYFFFDDANDAFDMKRPFEFLNREMTQLSTGYITAHSTFVDMLVKVYRKENDDFVIFHVEVQDKRQVAFPQRMFDYFIKLIDRYKKKVISSAVFTTPDEAFTPSSHTYDFFGTTVTFTFNSFNISAQKEAIFNRPENPFSFIFLTVLLSHQQGRIHDSELLKEKIKLAEKLFSGNWPDNQKVRLLDFLRAYIHFEKEEFNYKFEQEIDLLTRKNNTDMGIRERLIEYYSEQKALKIAGKMIRKGMNPILIQDLTDLDLHDIRVARNRYLRRSLWKRRQQ